MSFKGCFIFGVKVCHSRGLDTAEIDTEGLVRWLTEWIELSDAASGE